MSSGYEPLPVPMEVEDLRLDWWYCLDCGHRFATPLGVENHWKKDHGEGLDAAVGVDYARGDQLVRMQERRRRWIEEQALHFAGEMHRDFGPDDFVAEAEIRDAR